MRFRVLLAALTLTVGALVSVAAQQVEPKPDAPYGERMPADYHCKRSDVTISKGERAVHCDCQYSCTMDEHGNVTEHEDLKCLAACREHRQFCTCWPEGDPAHPCAKDGNRTALMDMDGRIVAVRRR